MRVTFVLNSQNEKWQRQKSNHSVDVEERSGKDKERESEQTSMEM